MTLISSAPKPAIRSYEKVDQQKPHLTAVNDFDTDAYIKPSKNDGIPYIFISTEVGLPWNNIKNDLLISDCEQ